MHAGTGHTVNRKTVAQDDTGSLVVALLVSVVGMLMSAVLATIVLGQITTTRNVVQRQHAVDAALAGLDVATGHLRATGDAQGNGVRTALPCGPFAGPVWDGGAATYTVTIAYLSSAGTPLTCVAGLGLATAPATANLVAVGVDRPGNPPRTLEATYRFRTTNQNIAGGQIHVYRAAGDPALCLDAGSATPATGTPLKVQLCDAGSPQQTFAYNTNLTLSLVSSATGGMPQGMCLDTNAIPHVMDAAVTFQQCAITTQARQQWSFLSNATFVGTSNSQDLDGYCFNVQTPGSAGSPNAIVLRTGVPKCNSPSVPFNNERTFSPDRQVGAGAAGASTHQLVNFYEFGRCLDVPHPNWDDPELRSPLIAWPCKQSPDGTQILWNQRWQLPTIADSNPTAGLIRTQPDQESYSICLVSPLVVAAATYVTLGKCPTSGPDPAPMQWKVYGNTGTYATSYTITDSNGLCLAPTDPDKAAPDLYDVGDKVSKVIVVNCSGSTLEKWNAPPYLSQPSPLKNIGER